MKQTILLCVLVFLINCSKDEDFVSVQEQLEKDIVIIDRYLADNNIGALKHSSGIRYLINKEGSGERPNVNSIVKVKYKGYFMSNGETFDSNDGLETRLTQVISGWQIGIPLFSEGGSGTLYIPSGHGYGRNGRNGVPDNAILIFDIDLLKIR